MMINLHQFAQNLIIATVPTIIIKKSLAIISFGRNIFHSSLTKKIKNCEKYVSHYRFTILLALYKQHFTELSQELIFSRNR